MSYRILIYVLGLLIAGSAKADIEYFSVSGINVEESLRTGEKQLLVVDDSGGQLIIGKWKLNLDAGYKILGAATDHRYLAVISGHAKMQGMQIKRGEVLIIQPWNAQPRKAIFEAETLAEFVKGINPELDHTLARLIKSQNRKLFFGRYTRTAFDLQNPGGKDVEKARSRVAGNDVISKIRYSGETDQVEIERQVIEYFVDAMNSGDYLTAGVLLDPTSYGGSAMSELDMNARKATVKILARNWVEIKKTDLRQKDDMVWVSNDTQINLIVVEDFIYIASVSHDS